MYDIFKFPSNSLQCTSVSIQFCSDVYVAIQQLLWLLYLPMRGSALCPVHITTPPIFTLMLYDFLSHWKMRKLRHRKFKLSYVTWIKRGEARVETQVICSRIQTHNLQPILHIIFNTLHLFEHFTIHIFRHIIPTDPYTDPMK